MGIKDSKTYRLITEQFGIDGAIAYSSGARVFQALAGVVNVFFIAAYLSPEEQGFYYTFGSVLAIRVFFELGFTGIMTQYVAHEAAHLKLDEEGRFEGEEKYLSRLAYLTKFCIKWYAIISAVFFVVILIVGYLYFEKYDTTNGAVNWKGPWLLISISSAIALFQSPLSAILQGLGKVKETSMITFYQQFYIPILQWILLASGVSLYVVGIGSLAVILIWFIYVGKMGLWKILMNLMREKVTEKVSYFKEIFPYQWKIAVSWMSGYFIFQLFNPVLFATEGAVVAGQMGMTLSVLNAIQAFALNWQNTKVPRYSALIELKQYDELDSLFDKTLKQMSVVCCGLLAAMFGAVYLLRATGLTIRGSVVGDRFLDYIPLLLMMIPVLINQFVSSWATYLRCHKQEPILVTSVVVAILCCCSTFGLGNIWGVYGITGGYCAIRVLVSLPWIHHIFVVKKREWHTNQV